MQRKDDGGRYRVRDGTRWAVGGIDLGWSAFMWSSKECFGSVMGFKGWRNTHSVKWKRMKSGLGILT